MPAITQSNELPAKLKVIPPKEISVDEILKAKGFSDFLNAAKDYCSFIETESSMTDLDYLKAVQAHLLNLYALARNLPAVQLQTDKDFESGIDDSAMKPVFKFIGDRIPFSYYWVVLNPVDVNNPTETGTGDLTDDLGDIYEDLKRTIVIYDINDVAAKENAVWKFQFDFDFHWGEHCIEALSAIHHYLLQSR